MTDYLKPVVRRTHQQRDEVVRYWTVNQYAEPVSTASRSAHQPTDYDVISFKTVRVADSQYRVTSRG